MAIDLADASPFNDQVYLGETQQKADNDENLIRVKNELSSKMTNSDTNVPVNNNKRSESSQCHIWEPRHDRTRRNTRKDIVSRHTRLRHNFTRWLHPVETIISKYDFDTVGDFADECAQIALKCLYHALLGRPDILWAGNLLARVVRMK